jgi:hypothetical protein
MKKRLKELKPLYVELADTKLEEERVEKIRELLKKEQFEVEKAGLEGLALRRAQANQEFEQDKADWDKKIKEGEVGWAEYAQAIIYARERLKGNLSGIAKDETEIWEKLKNETIDIEKKMAIDRAVGREKDLLEIEYSREKELMILRENIRKQVEQFRMGSEERVRIEEEGRKQEALINQKYDMQKQEALAKLEPLQEMVLTKVIDSMVDLVAITKDWGEYFKSVIQQLMMDLVKLAVRILLAKAAMDIFKSSATTIGGIFGIPAAILTAFKPTMGIPTPAMAGTPVLPKLAPAMPAMNFGYPVVNNRTSREIKVFSTINIQGDVLDMDQFYRKKIRPAQQRFFGKRFE